MSSLYSASPLPQKNLNPLNPPDFLFLFIRWGSVYSGVNSDLQQVLLPSRKAMPLSAIAFWGLPKT
jgi:hypothetical protein